MREEIKGTMALEQDKADVLSETVRLDVPEGQKVALELIQNIVLIHTEEDI